MAKKSSIQKNLNRKKIVSKFRNRRKSLKKMIMQKNLTMEERFKLQTKLNDFPRDSANIRVRNRCEITGRTRAVYRKFGLSRIKLRELTMSGSLPGVVKSSW
jgi:small subunit ribosomal protein S14